MQIRRLSFIHRIVAILSLVGIGSSAYLTYEHFGNRIVCIGSGCSLVDASAYSEIFGIPLGILGLAVYLAVLALALSYSFDFSNPYRRYLDLGLYGISLTGVIFSLYLTYLEFFVIRAVCTWCMVSLFVMLIIFVAAVFNLRNFKREG